MFPVEAQSEQGDRDDLHAICLDCCSSGQVGDIASSLRREMQGNIKEMF